MARASYLRVYTPELVGSRAPVPGFVKSYGILSETEGEGHWTAEWAGRHLVCPRNLRLRVLESTVAFAGAFRALGVGLIPEEAARAADRELRAYRRDHPQHRSQVLTTAWHVPVRWFTMFDPSEREVYDGPHGLRLRYRTEMSLARERVSRAYQILDRLDVLTGPAEELAHLAEWLAPFPEDSMVELDYAEVSELFDPQDLVLDDSCELVQRSVTALAEGDMMKAGESYGRVITRWAPAFSLTFSN